MSLSVGISAILTIALAKIRIANAIPINCIADPLVISVTLITLISFNRIPSAEPKPSIPLDKSFISIFESLSIDNAKIPKAIAIINNDPILILCVNELIVPWREVNTPLTSSIMLVPDSFAPENMSLNFSITISRTLPLAFLNLSHLSKANKPIIALIILPMLNDV